MDESQLTCDVECVVLGIISFVCKPHLTKCICLNSLLRLDLDECGARSHDCQQVCVNTEGSFRCECHSGFMLNRDRKSCQGIVTLHFLNVCTFRLFVSNTVA